MKRNHWSTTASLVLLGLVCAFVETGRGADCQRVSTGLVPLTELGKNLYEGHPGGLYPEGSNERPPVHEAAGLRLAHRVEPLDEDGEPYRNGRIVLLSIGMSNTTQEFSVFKRLADEDPDRNPRLTIVDGAQGGMSADRILDPDDGGSGTQFWETVDARLQAAGVTPLQVQAVWVKQADARPTLGFPAYPGRLQRELAIIARILKTRFPHVKLAYESSRIYAGYAITDLNPEPYAYQSGFAVKWLIERQIRGDRALRFDPAEGEARAPWLSWGPYLWADGLVPRGDGLIWRCGDFQPDGTHPSPRGRLKVAVKLLEFFKSDPTTVPWFLRGEK